MTRLRLPMFIHSRLFVVLSMVVFAGAAAAQTAQPWSTGTYTYDGMGNIKSIGTDQFRYDGQSRLVTSTAGPGRFQNLTYDAYGNIRTMNTDGTTKTFGVNASTNRLTEQVDPVTGQPYNVFGTYDSAGRLTVAAGVGNSFDYDALDTVSRSTVEGTTKVHLYNTSGQRIASINTGTGTWELTLRDTTGKVLRRVEKNGGQWTWKQDYVHFGTRVLASEVATPAGTLHYFSDHLNTPRLITGNGGTKIAFHTYHPFGDEVTSPAQDSEKLKFTGHERDAPSVDYMHARYYGPKWGRFLVPDPKSRLSALTTPQLYNRYSYAMNAPLKFVDLNGEDITPIRVLMTNGKPGIQYVDSRIVARIQTLVLEAQKQGVTFTFNEVFRTQQQQKNIKTSNTKNTAGTSPHVAGLAVDVNVDTGMQGTDLAGFTKIAGKANMVPLSNQQADRPHFQANDLITRDKKGKADDDFKALIEENQYQYEELENLRINCPEFFETLVIDITPTGGPPAP